MSRIATSHKCPVCQADEVTIAASVTNHGEVILSPCSNGCTLSEAQEDALMEAAREQAADEARAHSR